MIKAMDIWLPGYLGRCLKPLPQPEPGRPLVLYVTIADHFEPFWMQADEATAESRISAWEDGLPGLCEGLADSRGKPPQHCFFYPLEDYRPWVLDRLKGICSLGLGDVEVHLHHHGETSDELEGIFSNYAQTLYTDHGLLRKDPQTGRVLYGFIHGNWALDNSRPDGKWCGVNNELLVLKRSGCYADFTLPSAPSRTQTRMVNSIYYAVDDPGRPKSHDLGRPAAVGKPPTGDLLLLQGVLALNWRRRKFGCLPRLEDSDLGRHRPPSPDRIPLWITHAPVVLGAERHRFIKLSCHGAPEQHHRALLGRPMREMLQRLCTEYNDGRRYILRFATCWEMVQAVHALENGEEPQ